MDLFWLVVWILLAMLLAPFKPKPWPKKRKVKFKVDELGIIHKFYED